MQCSCCPYSCCPCCCIASADIPAPLLLPHCCCFIAASLVLLLPHSCCFSAAAPLLLLQSCCIFPVASLLRPHRCVLIAAASLLLAHFRCWLLLLSLVHHCCFCLWILPSDMQCASHTRDGTRTHNLLLRGEAPYPLGHTSCWRRLGSADYPPKNKCDKGASSCCPYTCIACVGAVHAYTCNGATI